VRELAAALPRTIATLPRAMAGLPAWVRARPHRRSLSLRARRRIVGTLLAAIALLALYHFWLRDSAIVAVNEVEVTGLTTEDGPRIHAALTATAEEMTTLHVRLDELEETASRYPVIGSIEVERDFPHGLRIAVEERASAALVELGGVPVPVAGDGTVLEGLQPPKGLALLKMEKPVADGRVTDPRTLRALLVAGAAPAGLTERIQGVTENDTEGITVELRKGPDVIVGDADLLHEKWTAAARVLADPSAQGATYIDVRLPERPVAGGLPVETIAPVLPAGEPLPVPVTPAAPEATDPTAVDPATGLPPVDPVTGAPTVDPVTGAPVTEPAPAPTTTAPTAETAPTEPVPTTPQP